MLNKRLSILMLVCLALGLWWYHGQAGGPAAAPRPVATSVMAPGAQWRTSAATDPEAMRAQPDFARAGDLYRHAQELRAASRHGDVQALWVLSRIFDYCALYAGDAAGYENDTRQFLALNTPPARAMAASRAQVSSRCARFTPQDQLSPSLIVATRVQAAQAGSLPAEAALLAMGTPINEQAAYTRDLVDRVRRSRDPEAFLALAPAMGIAASGEQAHFGPVSGTQLAELAWQLAACRLGADCAPNGSLMTAYCAHGGICSRDASQDFSSFVMEAGVPVQGASRLNEMVNGLVADKK